MLRLFYILSLIIGALLLKACHEKESYCLVESIPFVHQGSTIPAFDRIEDALQCANACNKNVLVYFIDSRSVNGQKLHDTVLAKPKFEKIIKNNYVNCILWGDDRTELRQPAIFLTDSAKEGYRNRGMRNSHLLLNLTRGSTAPVLVMIDKNGKVLSNPLYYPFTVEDFEDWVKGKG